MTVAARVAQMSPAERGMAMETALLLPAARAGLAFMRFPAVQRALEWYARSFRRRSASRDPELLDRVTRVVEGMARRLPGASTCLVQALVAHALLRRHRLPARLRIGVRRGHAACSSALEAHAWVECEGRVVVGDLANVAEYRPLRRTRHRLRQGLKAVLRGDPVPWDDLATDPVRLLKACARDDLTALLLHRHASGNGERHQWPDAVRETLAERARAEVGAELVRGREVRCVLDALAAAGVRPLLLKGTALAYTIYDQPSLRPRCDTDLLIQRGDADPVRRLLSGMGYTAPVYCDGELLFRQFELQRRDHFGLTHAFDFHWQISTQAIFANLFDYDELAAGTVPVPALGAHARTIGWPEALLLACVHPVMHHRNEQRLIWVYDIHLLAARLAAPEWVSFLELAIWKSMAAICVHGLGLATELLGTHVPPLIMECLRRATTRAEGSAQYLRPGRSWRHELASNLRALGWRDRLRLLRELAFPGASYMLRAYGLTDGALRRALLPVLYVHRGVKGAWKIQRGRK